MALGWELVAKGLELSTTPTDFPGKGGGLETEFSQQWPVSQSALPTI